MATITWDGNSIVILIAQECTTTELLEAGLDLVDDALLDGDLKPVAVRLMLLSQLLALLQLMPAEIAIAAEIWKNLLQQSLYENQIMVANVEAERVHTVRLGSLSAREKKAVELFAAFVNPAAHGGVKMPVSSEGAKTCMYQARREFQVNGVAGTAVGLTADRGRFCVVVNPIIADLATGFNTTLNKFQISQITGVDNTAVWPQYFVSTATNPFCLYSQDLYADSWVKSNHNGDMQKCRPVSASVLAKYNGKILEGAGTICGGLVRAGAWDEQLTNTDANALRLANHEVLNSYPDTTTHQLNKGVYVYWKPDDQVDFLMKNVQNTHQSETMSSHDYPLMVVSGIINDTSNSSLLFIVTINFEYTPNNNRFTGTPTMADPMVLECALQYLRQAENCHENPDHINWLNAMIGGVAGFVLGGPMGAAFGAAAGAGINLAGLMRR